MPLAGKLIELKIIVLDKINQTQKPRKTNIVYNIACFLSCAKYRFYKFIYIYNLYNMYIILHCILCNMTYEGGKGSEGEAVKETEDLRMLRTEPR